MKSISFRYFPNQNSAPAANFFNHKIVRLVLVINILLLATLIILLIKNATKTSTLVLNITPLDSKITLNGDGEYMSTGTYNLTPGHYKVEISHPDLISKTFELDLEPGHNTNLTAFLSGEEGDLDFYRQKNNLGSFDKLKEITTTNENLTIDQDEPNTLFISMLDYNYSMMSRLPLDDVQYIDTDQGRELAYDITIRANYGDDCSTWLCLEALMLGTDDKNLVSQLLTNHGFSTEDYEIKYTIY